MARSASGGWIKGSYRKTLSTAHDRRYVRISDVDFMREKYLSLNSPGRNLLVQFGATSILESIPRAVLVNAFDRSCRPCSSFDRHRIEQRFRLRRRRMSGKCL